MDILIGFAVAALKAGVSGVVGNEIVQALADQGIDISSEKLSQYLEKAQKELSQVLSDKSLIKMNVPEDYMDYIKEEIKGLLRSISLDEDLFRNCHYDAKSLAEALYKKYKRQKKDFVECESEIQKVLYVMSEKAISLEKERDGFAADSLVYLMKNEDDQMELLRKILHTLDEFMKIGMTNSENGKESERKKRLPDRTEEYRRKWTENMFLNDFDEDDENAGVNIPLHKLYQLPLYRLKDQKKDLSNLGERLDRCTKGQDPKNRMLLILGQPGMGKSTMITWFVQRYQEKQDADKKEILAYRFTDLNIEGSFNSIGVDKKEQCIDSAILKCLNIEKQDLNGKILILDGFDEVVFGKNRTEILNCLYNVWAQDTRIKDFSLLVTCRENYIGDLFRLSFPYIIRQPWNDDQIDSFCRNYVALTKSSIYEIAIDKMKELQNIFGIPIVLYMVLALGITVSDESSVVEVYDQIFSLIYDRCLKSDASVRSDDKHRIAEIKEQIHQFSREIAMWMFENNSKKAVIPKNEYEKIRDEIFKKDDDVGEVQKKDVLIGNYFRMVHYYNGIDTAELTFVHRSIYEYFVAETICSEIRDTIIEMTKESQEKLAGVLGYRLKKGRIDYTIGQYLKAKVSLLIATYSEVKKNQFYIWLEETFGKMLDVGMLYYTEENIKEYKNVIEKELNCFLNFLDILRMFVVFSDQKYILQGVDQKQLIFYLRCLTGFVNNKKKFTIDLSKTYLLEADLREVNLRGVDIQAANLIGADLRQAKLVGADIRGAKLIRANLKEANLAGANLTGADITGADIRGADITGADIREANLTGAYLTGADITGADICEAKLTRAYLDEANLIGTYLVGADIRGANLTGANLGEAKLVVADIQEANLAGANLGGANLIGADIRGANLRGANLKDAELDGSIWFQEDVDQYINYIKQANFNMIYLYSKGTHKKRKITFVKLLSRYPVV